MAWRIVKQPNGLFARFSDIVDHFTDLNMSEDDVINVCKRQYGLSSDASQAKLANAIADKECRWQKSMKTIRVIHGEDEANKVLLIMSKKDKL